MSPSTISSSSKSSTSAEARGSGRGDDGNGEFDGDGEFTGRLLSADDAVIDKLLLLLFLLLISVIVRVSEFGELEEIFGCVDVTGIATGPATRG